MLLHCLLTCIDSDKKSAIVIFITSLYIMCLFSLATCKVFRLSLVLAIWLWCAFVWFSSWFLCFVFIELVRFVNVQFPSNSGNFQPLFSEIIFLAYPSLFFRDSNYTYVRLFEIVLQLTDFLFQLKEFLFLSLFHFR